MLRLCNINKNYYVNQRPIEVLKDLNISFRKNEFVSLLGPSGSGKTTILNIIGGLDKYDSGNLFIVGKSTKKFSDHDWDIYRNLRIGFIFQSYNLISHQTILENVMLALTIAGISKEERYIKAKNALDKVGLAGMYNKKPNQLSGGQCQRVAIARALVNNPDILLADEPTGALDTKTSIQIMELIKEISNDKLVIMVTHNPDLAVKYSSRIVKIKDGKVVDDTNPFSEQDEINEVSMLTPNEINKRSKAKMNFKTSFSLSIRNLLSKKKRTILTCVASSIGIIGVSSVLSLSNGVKNYINDMETDMLSGNPIIISESSYDLESLMSNMDTGDKIHFIKEENFANVDSVVSYLVNRYSNFYDLKVTNNITNEYVSYIKSMPKEAYSNILFDYDLDLSYNLFVKYNRSNSSSDNYTSLFGVKSELNSILSRTKFSTFSSLIGSSVDTIKQAPSNSNYILDQYDLLDGKIATQKDEIMIVLDKDQAITDITLGQFGYLNQEDFVNYCIEESSSPSYDSSFKISFDELKNLDITYYPNNDVYSITNNLYTPLKYKAYKDDSFSDGLPLHVSGILMPKSNVSYGCLKRGIYYTEELTKYVINESLNSNIVSYFNENNISSYTSNEVAGIKTGITFDYSYTYNGITYNETGLVGSDLNSSYLSSLTGASGDNYISKVMSLANIGGKNLPTRISIYSSNFDQKNKTISYLDDWNTDEDIIINNVEYSNRPQIKYTDTLSLIITMINQIINMITIALICFTSLSLVVSCVMIAIVTYISVVERVKEIGVIRSLGGRKRDVSNLFRSETIIIGFISGLIGVALTYVLSFLANIIIGKNIAILPISYSIIMVLLSICLTYISGHIPSKSAARMDPVKALRNE